jgi:flavin reductase (DIM6/NTAB) family NADH-FMN oxidoreductase RutF
MKHYKKKDFPTSQIRRFLEPGPIVLVSSTWKGESNIMTMGWHTMMEFTPSLFGCIIAGSNHSFDMIRKSKECVINIPTIDLSSEVVGIGNWSGGDVDKFKKFSLTAAAGLKVKAPLIEECYANFECRIKNSRMVSRYNFFIFECLKAHVAVSPIYPTTLHYRGDGVFMVSGKHVSFKKKFRPENL